MTEKKLNKYCAKCPHHAVNPDLKDFYNMIYEVNYFWNCEKNLNDPYGHPCFCSGVRVNWSAFEASLIKHGFLKEPLSASGE